MCWIDSSTAGSIPDEVIGFFNWPNPSSRAVALDRPRLWHKQVAGIFLEGKGGLGHKADNLIATCEQLSRKCGSPEVT
jgi:hypothetical protein